MPIYQLFLCIVVFISGQAKHMKPFKFDGSAPNEQEFMVLWVNNTEVYGQHWANMKQRSALQVSNVGGCDDYCSRYR